MPLSQGTRLGPYEILAPIGAGGMGEVYRARDTRLERTVAIKVLPEHLSENAELRQRFEREAKAISSLSHPHICSLYDVGHQDGTDYLVMEFLEGETLTDRLAKGPLPTEQVIRCGIEIADALDKAHHQGIIHRDLKPGNVMLTKSGVKLLDFGLAKIRATGRDLVGAGLSTLATEASPSRPLTQQGTILGTFQYMAPEQLEGKEADARTDIFAFGAVLYEMATGQKTFSGKSQASLISSIMTSEPPPISSLQPFAPPALDHVVRVCLAKDPEDRWQTAHDLESELKWIASAGSHAGMAAPLAARRKNRERIAWALVIAATLTALVFALGYFRRAPASPRAIRFEIIPSGWEGTNWVFAPAVSPDGRRVAYAAEGQGGRRYIWIRSLDAVAAHPIAGTEHAEFPFWSPDGISLGFFAEGKLKRVAASGGPVQSICNAEAGRGGTWNREGTILFCPNSFSPIYRVSASGGEPTQITHLDSAKGETSHRWPQFLPDGRHYLYFVYVSDSFAEGKGSGGVFAGSLDGKVTKPILREQSNAVYAAPGYLLFYRDRNLIAQPFDAGQLLTTGEPFPVAERVYYDSAKKFAEFSVSEGGVLAYTGEEVPRRSRLRWFDRAGREVGSLGNAGNYWNPRLSPDGNRVALVVMESEVRSNIWIVDASRGIMTRFTASPFDDDWPVWFPDSRRIAFSSNRGGGGDQIFAKDESAAADQPLRRSKTSEIVNDVSPDGRFVVYSAFDPKTGWDLWTMNLASISSPVPFGQTPFNEDSGQFSPDGRWLAYVSDETGIEEVYTAPFPGPGPRVQVSSGGGSSPRWRRDGKELFFLVGGRKLMAVAIKTGSRLEAGTQRLQVELRDALTESFWGYDVSADGQRFLVNTPEGTRSPTPITVVLNWTADLNR